jgi:membrane protein DedA with SNARE-associated domain
MTSLFTQNGLPLLFAGVGIESVGISVPGETALIAFGVLASQGYYSITLVIVAGSSGACSMCFRVRRG